MDFKQILTRLNSYIRPLSGVCYERRLYFISSMLSILSNVIIYSSKPVEFNSVIVDTVLNEKIDIRAITVNNDRLWYAGDGNRFGYYNFKTAKKEEITKTKNRTFRTK